VGYGAIGQRRTLIRSRFWVQVPISQLIKEDYVKDIPKTIRAFFSFGFAVFMSAITWLCFFGILFLIDDAHHAKAGMGMHNPPGSFAWQVFPIMLTIIIFIASFIASFKSSLEGK
jgi:hypothetical protein